MSFQALAWVLNQDDVFGVDKYVLFMLAYRDNADDPHGCFPSMERIAKDCGIDRSTVIRCVEELEKRGKILRMQRNKPDGSPTSNYYSFPQVWQISTGAGSRTAPLPQSQRATRGSRRLPPESKSLIVNEKKDSSSPSAETQTAKPENEIVSREEMVADVKRILEKRKII